MNPEQGRRLATAVGFLAGLLACLDALRNRKIFWPLSAVWHSLPGPQQLELSGGIALILITLIVWVVQQGRIESRRRP